MAPYRTQLFSSLVVFPIANALGHMAPAIGASWAAAGRPIWDHAVLTLLFCVHVLLDSYDKYRDMPSAIRPSAAPWATWAGGLALLITWVSSECGIATAVRLVWYLGLEIGWSAPLIPLYTLKSGFTMVKLKQVLGPFKSVFCGVMAGLMDAGPAALHACILDPAFCSSHVSADRRFKALCYSVLYNFVRETIYDVRDIHEDTKDGITTMATTLGMRYALSVLLITALVAETWIGGQISAWGLGRAVGVVGLSFWVATHPRESRWRWAAFSLLSLLPAWHAQAALG